jgi:hypothetical protein
MTFVNFFLNVMIRNNKIHNILDIIENLKFMEHNKYIYYIYLYIYTVLNVSYDFFKFDESKKIKV